MLRKQKSVQFTLKRSDFKCLIVGDTIKLNDETYTQAYFIERYKHPEKIDIDYMPVVSENLNVPFDFEGKTMNIALWASDGEQQYSRLMQLAYHGTDILILLFSYEDPYALMNVQEAWYPEFRKNIPRARVFLIGLHSETQEREIVKKEEVINLSADLGMNYIDCASLPDANFNKIFNKIFYDYLFKQFSRFDHDVSFFSHNFSSVKKGMEFAVQVAYLSRGNLQSNNEEQNNYLATLSAEVMFMIFDQLGRAYLRDVDDADNRAALCALYTLIYENVATAKASTGTTMFWNRQYQTERREPYTASSMAATPCRLLCILKSSLCLCHFALTSWPVSQQCGRQLQQKDGPMQHFHL